MAKSSKVSRLLIGGQRRDPKSGHILNETFHQFRSPDDLKKRMRETSGISEKTADRILEAFPDGRGLPMAQAHALQKFGATPAQAKRLASAFRMVRACDELCTEITQGTRIGKPSDVATLLRETVGRQEQEYFVAILLDSRQRVMDVLGVALGSLAQVDVHPRELFRDAVRHRAHSIILAHNHPSGDASPSQADEDITVRMVEIGKLIGIPVLDHVVVSGTKSTSLAQLGLV